MRTKRRMRRMKSSRLRARQVMPQAKVIRILMMVLLLEHNQRAPLTPAARRLLLLINWISSTPTWLARTSTKTSSRFQIFLLRS